MLIRPLTMEDLDGFVDHVVRHMGENAQGGAPLFAPFSSMPKTPAQIRDRNERGWLAEVRAEGWMRTWGAFDDEDRFVGHADLRERGGPNTEHRTLLGMGVLAGHRRQGLGGRLLTTVAAWAKEEAFDWLDLFVLEPNLPAQALYRSFGFREVSRIDDFFRIDGRAVGDIGMTLDLRPWAATR